jgi:hypothetical protein
MLHSTPGQQVSSNAELEVLVSKSEPRKKFTGDITAGKLKASSLDNGEPGGASFHPKASVRDEGRQAAEPSSSGIARGSAVAPLPTKPVPSPKLKN